MTAGQVFRNVLAFLAAVLLVAVALVSYKIVLILLMAVLLGSALRPVIGWLQQRGLPQQLALFIVYASLALIALAVFFAIVPPMLNRFAGYLENDSFLANRIIIGKNYIETTLSDITGSAFSMGIEPSQIREAVSDFVAGIRTTAPDVLGSALEYAGAFVIMIVMGAYWINSRDTAVGFILSLFPLGDRVLIQRIIGDIEVTLGAYLRGILTISLTVGLLSFVPLLLLGVPNAAVISFLYGAATTVPIIGGLIGVVLATAVGLLTSPTAAITVFVITVLLQQFEEYVLSPRIMSQSVEFNPILVITFISMGFALNGLTGALLAVPIAGSAAILLKYLILEPRQNRVAEEVTRGAVLLTPGSAREPGTQ